MCQRVGRIGDAEAWYAAWQRPEIPTPPTILACCDAKPVISRKPKPFPCGRRAGDSAAKDNLGLLLEERGDTAEAQRCRQQADETRSQASHSQAVLLETSGRPAEAERLYMRDALRGDSDTMSLLAMMLKNHGLPQEAEHWLRARSISATLALRTSWRCC